MTLTNADSLSLTLQKVCRKINTHVSIPRAVAARHRRGYSFRVNFFNFPQDAVPATESDNDFGHTKQERLDPEFAQLALKEAVVLFAEDLGRGLEFDPADGVALFAGFGVPDWWWMGQRKK